MIRVLLADDQPVVRAGFRMLLEGEDDIAVVGEAGDGDVALKLIASLVPDVVLMDIRMPGLDGLEALRRMAADHTLSTVRVLILTTFEIDEYVFDAIRLGASGYLVKHTKPEDLVRAVREVAAGDALLSPSVTRRLIEEFAARPTRPQLVPPAMSRLTDREAEVVALVAHGSHPCEPSDGQGQGPRSRPTRRLRVPDRARATSDLVACRPGLEVCPTHGGDGAGVVTAGRRRAGQSVDCGGCGGGLAVPAAAG
jgi:DNA-binding NarL/FixJ family response regulator